MAPGYISIPSREVEEEMHNPGVGYITSAHLPLASVYILPYSIKGGWDKDPFYYLKLSELCDRSNGYLEQLSVSAPLNLSHCNLT